MQLSFNNRQQLVHGGLVAVVPINQQSGYVGIGGIHRCVSRSVNQFNRMYAGNYDKEASAR
jgi:hypothetical protein